MENVVEYFETMEGAFRKTKMLTILVSCVSAFIALGSLVFAASFVSRHSDHIYVLDRGDAYSATVAGQNVERDLEAKSHIERFHELMFNLSPSSEAIKRNLDRALVMSDRSAYTYYSDNAEKGFYQRLVSANITEQISIDSTKVDMSVYPYDVRVYATLYLIRESNITAYDFESTCQLVDVGRSESNPHGFMIERFSVRRNEKRETRRRM